MLEEALPERDPQETIFRLTLSVLEQTTAAESSTVQPWMPLTYFTLWITRLMGLLPDIAHCTVCGEALQADEVNFNFHADGLFCAVHRHTNDSLLSPDSWQMALRMLRAPVANFRGRRVAAAPRRRTSADSCMNTLERHLERKLRSAEALARLLRRHIRLLKSTLSPIEERAPVSSSTLSTPQAGSGARTALTFQDLLFRLQGFWAERGCVLQQPYDVEVGAGTMAPETFLRVLGPRPYKVGYAQPSRRPADGRYGENPNRLFKHTQFQLILKPPPENVQELYLQSLEAIGIDLRQHDFKFEEDNWEWPAGGAWGVGWQVMLDGLEITQFTYFQQCGGLDLDPICAELTYGLERIAKYLQDVKSIYDIVWARDPETGADGDLRRSSARRRSAVQGVQL